MLGPSRNHKIATILQRAISEVIINYLKDPRVTRWVSVSEVELSKDKSFARVYVTMLADEKQHVQAVDALNSATGFIRSKLGGMVELKYIPKIKFFLDKSITQGQYLSALIDKNHHEEQ